MKNVLVMDGDKQQKILLEWMKIIHDIGKVDDHSIGASHVSVKGHITVGTKQDNEVTSVHLNIEREFIVKPENEEHVVDNLATADISSSTEPNGGISENTEDNDGGSSTPRSTGTRPKTPGAYSVRISEK